RSARTYRRVSGTKFTPRSTRACFTKGTALVGPELPSGGARRSLEQLWGLERWTLRTRARQPGDYRRTLPRQGRRQDSTLVRPCPHGSELRADPVMLYHRLSLVEQECQIEWPPPTDFVVINVTGDAIVRGSLGRISLRVM